MPILWGRNGGGTQQWQAGWKERKVGKGEGQETWGAESREEREGGERSNRAGRGKGKTYETRTSKKHTEDNRITRGPPRSPTLQL